MNNNEEMRSLAMKSAKLAHEGLPVSEEDIQRIQDLSPKNSSISRYSNKILTQNRAIAKGRRTFIDLELFQKLELEALKL